MIPGKSDLRGESESAVASEFNSHLLTKMLFLVPSEWHSL